MVRDNKGRFQKGISGNPGGMKKSEFSISALIDKCVTKADWIDMLNAAKIKAKRGDIKCIEWLTDRRFGKPSQPITGKKDEPLAVTIVEIIKSYENIND